MTDYFGKSSIKRALLRTSYIASTFVLITD